MQSNGSAFNPGEVAIKWTASGDNGYAGTAAGYDLRYQPYSKGPLDTDGEWRAATRVIGESAPSPAGQIDSMVIRGLNYGASYYFGLKVYDWAGNYSALSNSPVLTAGDTLACSYRPGDANADGNVDLLDLIYLISDIFKGGPEPYPMVAGDVNGDGDVDLLDILYLITDIYKNGPPPVCRY